MTTITDPRIYAPNNPSHTDGYEMSDYHTWAETPEGRWPQIMEQARMSEMIERVAKAIAKARGGWHADEGQWRSCEDEARAAIQALRDWLDAQGSLSDEDMAAQEHVVRMIDEALK